MILTLIACIDPQHAIGYRNRLLWHLPDDLHHFRDLTLGHTIIMGRKTYESLPHGALPGRENIVLSRTRTAIDGCTVYPSLEKALQPLKDRNDNIFIIGGESVYREALPLAQRLCLTLVEKTAPKADAFFPHIEWEEWEEIQKEQHDGFAFAEYHRRGTIQR